MRNAVPQVAQVRSVDLAAARHPRLQNFCRLLGGAANSIRQCWHVSRFRPADFWLRPSSIVERVAQRLHLGEGLSALTSSTLLQSGQLRRRIPRFLATKSRSDAGTIAGALIASGAKVMRVPVGYLQHGPGGYPWLPDSGVQTGLHVGSSGHQGCPASRV